MGFSRRIVGPIRVWDILGWKYVTGDTSCLVGLVLVFFGGGISLLLSAGSSLNRTEEMRVIHTDTDLDLLFNSIVRFGYASRSSSDSHDRSPL